MPRYFFKWLMPFVLLALPAMAADVPEEQLYTAQNASDTLQLEIAKNNHKVIIQQIQNANTSNLDKITLIVFSSTNLYEIWDALSDKDFTNVTKVSIGNLLTSDSFKAVNYTGLAEVLLNVNNVTLSSFNGDHSETFAFLNSWKKPLNFFFVSIGKDQRNPDIKYGVYPGKQLRLPPVNSNNILDIMSVFNCLEPAEIDWVVLQFVQMTNQLSIDNMTFKIAEKLGSNWKNLKRLSLQSTGAEFDISLLHLFDSVFSAEAVDISGGLISPEALSKSLWRFTGKKLRAFEAYFSISNIDPKPVIDIMINVFNAQPNLEILEVFENWLHTAVVMNPGWNDLVNAAKHGGSKVKLIATKVFTTWDQIGNLADAFPQLEYLAMNTLEGFIDPGADASDVIEVFKKFKKLKHVFVNVGDCISFYEVYIENNSMSPVKITDNTQVIKLKNQLFKYFDSKKIKCSTKNMFDNRKAEIHKEILEILYS